ncbi:hypothetical protein PILCRDRAFT_97462 [Piloderma croceum F 1598]|uniref:Major facilitator superfamily (MFS) profile domain-containing protein n=1 Tax=Piloderma croceum (strain F 1598) TaxID=765440 RepID=A0A0C3BXU7_PILCF|nr:hypothetical protein PILCRDRAFT_97462 [Piloderma croceum F 1598]
MDKSSSTSWLYRPWTQLLLISFVCFCDPGMYNSISGIGGSGQLDPTVAANTTVALFSATAATAFTIVPTLFDYLGPRGCLLISGWTYPLYSGSLLCYNYTKNAGFVITAGAILGIGAALLWTAQGDIMLSYPPEHQQGHAITWFWVIFNVGGAVGGFMSFGLNFHSTAGTVSNSMYIAFIIVMAFGWLITVFIPPPNRVVRSDRSVVQRRVKSGLQLGFGHQLNTAVKAYGDWRIIALIPMFFCANIPYSYQQNAVNGATFTIHSRSLNAALYWLAQVLGGLSIGFILDIPSLHRLQRSKLGWIITFVMTFSIYGSGYAFQWWANTRPKGKLDFADASESFQATGGAMAWCINTLKRPAMMQFAMNWGLLAGSLLIGLPMMWTITDTTIDDEEMNEEEPERKQLIEFKE